MSENVYPKLKSVIEDIKITGVRPEYVASLEQIKPGFVFESGLSARDFHDSEKSEHIVASLESALAVVGIGLAISAAGLLFWKVKKTREREKADKELRDTRRKDLLSVIEKHEALIREIHELTVTPETLEQFKQRYGSRLESYLNVSVNNLTANDIKDLFTVAGNNYKIKPEVLGNVNTQWLENNRNNFDMLTWSIANHDQKLRLEVIRNAKYYIEEGLSWYDDFVANLSLASSKEDLENTISTYDLLYSAQDSIMSYIEKLAGSLSLVEYERRVAPQYTSVDYPTVSEDIAKLVQTDTEPMTRQIEFTLSNVYNFLENGTGIYAYLNDLNQALDQLKRELTEHQIRKYLDRTSYNLSLMSNSSKLLSTLSTIVTLFTTFRDGGRLVRLENDAQTALVSFIHATTVFNSVVGVATQAIVKTRQIANDHNEIMQGFIDIHRGSY